MTFFENSHEHINGDGASDFGASGFTSAPAVSSGGFTSDEVAVCCDSPHTTRTTTAIVVSSRCLISLQLSIHYSLFNVFKQKTGDYHCK
mgnify:CR=1 FL=1